MESPPSLFLQLSSEPETGTGHVRHVPKMNQPDFTAGSRKPEVVRILAGVEALRVQTLTFMRTVEEPERRALMSSGRK